MGLQIINAILDIAFNKLNLHRVDLGVIINMRIEVGNR